MGIPITYLMYGIPFYAMISNDLHRIRFAKSRVKYLERDEVDEKDLKSVESEMVYLIGDVIGFVSGVVILSPMRFV